MINIFCFAGDPNSNTSGTRDPYKTLFVARIVSFYFYYATIVKPAHAVTCIKSSPFSCIV